MRIDDLNRTPLAQGAEKPDPADPTRTREKNSGASGAIDQANVSDLAQALAAPDPQRIEQLRLAVESGAYDVSPDAVAKAIVDAHIHD